LNARSVIGGNLCGAARREIGDYGRAYIGTAATAVLEQVQRDLAEARLSLPKTSIQLRPLDWQSLANQGMIVA